MAKKKTKGSFTFKDITGLTDGILKKNKTSIKRETEKTASNRTFVGTGIYALNAAISSDIYGGIPDNRITVLAGESGCLFPTEKLNIYVMNTKNKKHNIHEEYKDNKK